MKKQQIKEMVSLMTLEEKAGMCSGADFWHLKGIERLGIPSVMVTDGPHGIRKQEEASDHLGINDSVKAVCFPAGCATAASFDREVMRKLGSTIGEECQAMGISTILGPAVNIKRSPLCGRNFEYYSEDPYLAAELGTAMVQGVQSKNVGVSVKHFLANNQEKRRMTSSSNLSERALREIYMVAFEGIVKKAKPWTIMSSYNRINGKYVGETKEYLTEVLRDEWGFDGYVMSDWGGTNERVSSLEAGLDLEMPSSNGINDALIVEAVKEGSLDEAVLDQTCERILDVIFRYLENRDETAVFNKERDHELAAKLEEECIVLLKNEKVLPLDKKQKVAFIGKFAQSPRYQGGGSSHINSWRVESALEAVKDFSEISFAKGYEDDKDIVDEKLFEEAINKAKEAEVAVVFAGLPDNFESEGYDRTHLNLPSCQNELIERILEVQENVIVVLHNGSPVLMPWKERVKGILEAYLGGQAVGKAVVNVLYGKTNPSGRLAETFPLKLSDTPCYLTYGKNGDHAIYQEDVFVGYRYYTSIDREVLFPFGYGLSYTKFNYSKLKLDKTELLDTETVKVSVTVKNSGTLKGKEVVQLYVSPMDHTTIRPLRELKGFDKIELEPGEEKNVTFELGKRAFAYWNEEIHAWYVPSGSYRIEIGENAEKMLLSAEVYIHGTDRLPKVYSMNSCIGDLLKDEDAQAVVGAFLAEMSQTTGAKEMAEQQENDKSGAVNAEMMEAMMEGMPLRQFLSFVPGMRRERLISLVDTLNENRK